MSTKYKWLVALGLATALLGTIILTTNNTSQTESKLKNEIQKLEHKTREQQRQEVEQLNNKIKELDTKLQSKKAEQARIAAETAQKAAQASLAQKVVNSAIPTAQAAGGDAKAFIYMRESGNNPGAINKSSGACGLGQALPCSKMPCSLSDYACQDNFFTGYMQHRYGTWENAQSFWLRMGWW